MNILSFDEFNSINEAKNAKMDIVDPKLADDRARASRKTSETPGDLSSYLVNDFKKIKTLEEHTEDIKSGSYERMKFKGLPEDAEDYSKSYKHGVYTQVSQEEVEKIQKTLTKPNAE